MASPRIDPYLWLHLWGLATVPFWLAGCLAALGAGDPIGPAWLEEGLLALGGAVPMVLLQGRRPWYPFALLFLYVRPTALTVPQRQLLQAYRAWWRPLGNGLLALALVMVGDGLYRLAPIASGATPFWGWNRLLAGIIATGCFLLANVSAQMALTALGLLLVKSRPQRPIPPYPVEAISNSFTYWGIPTNGILPRSLLPEEASALEVPESSRKPRAAPAIETDDSLTGWSAPELPDPEQPDSEPSDSKPPDSEPLAPEQPDSEQPDSEQSDALLSDSEQSSSEPLDSEQPDSEPSDSDQPQEPTAAFDVPEDVPENETGGAGEASADPGVEDSHTVNTLEEVLPDAPTPDQKDPPSDTNP